MASDSDDIFDSPNPSAPDSYKPDQSRKKGNLTSENERNTDFSSDGDHSERSSDQNRRQPNRRTRRSSSSRSSDRSSRSRSRRGKKNRYSSDSRSRSRSSGTDSRSRSSSRDSIAREEASNKNAKVASKRRDSDLSTVASSSDVHEKGYAETRNDARNQAWGAETKSRQSKQTHGYSNSKRQSSADDKKSRQRRSDRKHSPVHSDSDITDVSSMSSPRNGQRESRKRQDGKPPKSYSRAPGVHADSGTRDTDRHGDKKALELNLLTKAVSELEKQNRVQSNTRRVMFESGWPKREQKSNYTFSDSDTHRIEQENQRLLRQIMSQMQFVDSRYTGSTGRGKKTVIPASGINRLRDHNRIEKENLAFLKRLQQIRPSKGLSRQEQLSAYSSTLLHGVPISTVHNLAPVAGHHKTSKSQAGSEAGTLSRTRSVTSIQSAATASSLRSGQSGRLRSRPSSAKTSVRERPPWDDRW